MQKARCPKARVPLKKNADLLSGAGVCVCSVGIAGVSGIAGIAGSIGVASVAGVTRVARVAHVAVIRRRGVHRGRGIYRGRIGIRIGSVGVVGVAGVISRRIAATSNSQGGNRQKC